MRATILASCLLAAAGADALTPLANLPTNVPEPTLMDFAEPQLVYSSGACEAKCIYSAEPMQAVTFICWVRSNATSNDCYALTRLFCSAEDARPTTFGGAGNHNLGPMGDWTNVTLDAAGTWACPAAVRSPRDASSDEYPADAPELFSNGVWAVNIVSNAAPVTLVVAGTECQIPATNKYVRNLLGTASDPAVSISGTPGATLRLGVGELRPIKFYDRINGVKEEEWLAFQEGSYITNEWYMASFRLAIITNSIVTRDDILYWDNGWPEGKVEVLGKTTHGRFERGAQFNFGVWGFTSPKQRFHFYGLKLYAGWLDDDALARIRDRDVAEMRRRGIKQWGED